jgi:L,D-transpeptidase catalytic domain
VDGRWSFSAAQHSLAGTFLRSGPVRRSRRRIVIAAAAGFIWAGLPGDAAAWGFWPDYYEPSFVRSRPMPTRVGKPLKHPLAKRRDLANDTRQPQGPLILAISIEKQMLKVYDANGLFAETPVSTGMRGHPTPMGLFSVIQKQKYHRSNIYSGAPMPYMQRITWSGVAMHAGVLPGYPASHGCIRMPLNFAVKMWRWTRMGARVVITPGEMAPESFLHPLLATRKTVPLAATGPEAKIEVAVTATSDKAAMPDPAVTPGLLELKSTIGHEAARPATPQRTADAGATGSQPTMVDALLASNPAQQSEGDATRVETDSAAGVKKDQTRAPDADQAPATGLTLAATPGRSGQIAVFISRKDAKLYVRRNFAPLFDVPVIIAPDARPLGTHVFTALADKDDASRLRWSVVSLPVIDRHAAVQNEEERVSRLRRAAGAVEVKPAPLPDSAAEALNRLTIPAEAMARINEMLSSGSSIIVSDQGINSGETGTGTDFIIPLR